MVDGMAQSINVMAEQGDGVIVGRGLGKGGVIKGGELSDDALG